MGGLGLVTSISGRTTKTGNNGDRLSDSSADVIEFPGDPAQVEVMKHALTLMLLLALSWPATAQAACYADYKAKQDAPLRLHYGVAEIAEPCTVQSANSQLPSRLQQAGWTLLNVVSVFDDNGLAERKDSAGPHFLRY